MEPVAEFYDKKTRQKALLFHERNIERLQPEHLRLQFAVGDGKGNANVKMTLRCVHPDRPASKEMFHVFLEQRKRIRMRAMNVTPKESKSANLGSKTGLLVPVPEVWQRAYELLYNFCLEGMCSREPAEVLQKVAGKRRGNGSPIFETVTKPCAFKYVLMSEPRSQMMYDQVLSKLGLPDTPASWSDSQYSEFKAAMMERLRTARDPRADPSDEVKYREACKPWFKPFMLSNRDEDSTLPPRVPLNFKNFSDGAPKSYNRGDHEEMAAQTEVVVVDTELGEKKRLSVADAVRHISYDTTGKASANTDSFDIEIKTRASMLHIWVNGTGINGNWQLESLEFFRCKEMAGTDDLDIPDDEDDMPVLKPVKLEAAVVKPEAAEQAAVVKPEAAVVKPEAAEQAAAVKPEAAVVKPAVAEDASLLAVATGAATTVGGADPEVATEAAATKPEPAAEPDSAAVKGKSTKRKNDAPPASPSAGVPSDDDDEEEEEEVKPKGRKQRRGV